MRRILLLLIVLLIAGADSVMAQARKVTGRVLDERSQGLPGAGVAVKGTALGTVSDIDGNFSLDVPTENKILNIKSIGYAAQDVIITGSTLIIKMQPSSHQLKEAVVTGALNIKREKRDIGYSATTISSEELNAGNNVSALSAITGKTAGVNITSSTGGPGGSTRVVLRGEKSISNGNNNALIVVDGIPVNNSDRTFGANELGQIDYGNRGNDINPEDIESITVLKGPAAAALYGSQAANGAIMITTKSGKSKKNKKTELTYSASYTISDILKYPELQNQFGQGDMQNIPNDRRENFCWGLPFDGQLRPWGQVINGQQLLKPYTAQPDNIKSFFNIGHTLENQVSLAGGAGEKSSYYLSLNALNNTGVVPNTFYKKYGVRFNGSTQLSNHFYSSININYTNLNSRVEAQGQNVGSTWNALMQTPRDIPVWEMKDLSNPFYGYGFPDSKGVLHYGSYAAYAYNPYFLAEKFDNRDVTDRVLGNITVGYKPNDQFNIYDRVGGDFISDRVSQKTPKYSYTPFDPFYTGANRVSSGGFFQAFTNSGNYYNDLIATYDKPLNESFMFHGLLGNSIQYNRTNVLSSEINPTTNGLIIPDFYNFQNAVGPIISNNTLTESFLVGAYGSLRLDYKKSLFLEVTARNDWSSTLVKNSIVRNIGFFYPSASASWVFTETFKGSVTEKVLTYGKLRASYASVGNGALAYQNNPPGYVNTVANTSFGSVRFPFNSVPGYTYTNTVVDPNLRPERTNSWEIGTELQFFRDRLTFEATYYNNISIDQILSLPVPSSTGYAAYLTNVGDLTNKGVELALRVTPVASKTGFRWELFGTYTQNVNTVERLTGGVSQVTIGGSTAASVVAAVGKPFGAFYTTDFLRDPQGRVVIDPASGLPKTAPNPAYQGSYQPKFIASWGTTLKYKNFALNILFDTKQGGKFFSQTKRITDFVGTAPETVENDRQPYLFPNSVYQDANGNYVENTQYKFLPYNYYTTTLQNIYSPHIIDASYVKLREASLSYTLPAKWFSKGPFGSASVGVFGNNLFLWTAKSNTYVDPEVNSGGASNLQGFDFLARPSLRNYGFNLRVTF